MSEIEKLDEMASLMREKFYQPMTAAELASAAQSLEHIQRSRMLAYELEERKARHQANDVQFLREQVRMLVGTLADFEREFEAAKTPTAARVAARMRTALRDVAPGWEVTQT